MLFAVVAVIVEGEEEGEEGGFCTVLYLDLFVYPDAVVLKDSILSVHLKSYSLFDGFPVEKGAVFVDFLCLMVSVRWGILVKVILFVH